MSRNNENISTTFRKESKVNVNIENRKYFHKVNRTLEKHSIGVLRLVS